MYQFFHCLAKKQMRHHTDFEADLRPETGDVFFIFFGLGSQRSLTILIIICLQATILGYNCDP